MTRSEYLDTIEGQLSEHLKRRFKKVSLIVKQEPKGKNCSNDEKRTFRKEIRRQLKEQNRRPFRGNIILEIDYYTTKDNPPELQTLSKNYLDLLHKKMPHIDNLKSILYSDDNQIKILISNYHIDEERQKNPYIEISAYSLRYFLEDIELADRILTNNFSDSDKYSHSNFEEQLEEERSNHNKDYFEDLRELEEDKDDYDKLLGRHYYSLQKNYLLRQIQEQFLKRNNLNIHSLITLFQPYFYHFKKYSTDRSFQNLWDSSRNLIFFSPAFLHFGNAPQLTGETGAFNFNVRKELLGFREKFKILFPLLHPISVIVTYIPPKQKIMDLDNLAKSIVHFVNEIFKPPTIIKLTYKDLKIPDLLKNELEIIQHFPPNSIASYQSIQLPRFDNDPINGKIGFLITDGFYYMNNVWRTVEEIINKWERD